MIRTSRLANSGHLAGRLQPIGIKEVSMISKNLIHQYQKTYRHKFGEDISDKMAERGLYDLKELVRLICKERKNRHGR